MHACARETDPVSEVLGLGGQRQNITITVAQLLPEYDPNGGYNFKYQNFGEVLLGADVDGDGFADLVVGAPHGDPSVTTLQVANSNRYTAPPGAQQRSLNPKPPAFASPLQRGRVYVYLAASGLTGAVDSLAASALRYEGTADFQYFGASVAFGVVDGQRLVRPAVLAAG